VYVDYAGITHFDLYANTASDLIGGFFNLGAAIYYTIQVFKVGPISSLIDLERADWKSYQEGIYG
jgi:hypothetical protein